MAIAAAWKERVRHVKTNLLALCFACRDPRTPWYAKTVAACVVAYAFSPIDLIPDFIPVLGYLDDLVLLPLGIVLALRMIPPGVMADARLRASAQTGARIPASVAGAVAIILLWAGLAALGIWAGLVWWRGR